MTNKEEIIEFYDENSEDKYFDFNRMLLEILLDIRDLLTQKTK